MSIAVLSGLDAYRHDLAVVGRPTLGADDADWIRLAELLDRAARDRRRLTRPRRRREMPRLEMWHLEQARDAAPRIGREPVPRAIDPLHAYTATKDALRATLGVDTHRVDMAPAPTGPVSPALLGEATTETTDETSLLHAVTTLAVRMEDAGALALAMWVLGAAGEAFQGAGTATRAFAAVLRARVARKRGDLVYADDLYATAMRLARASHTPAIVAQATLGRGVVARMRGDYPSARKAFVAGVRLARRAGRPDLESAGHQGLLAAAATARDFATALAHGWAALELARGNIEAEADALGNLAAVAGDLGDHRAAVRGYLAAATRLRSARVRLPAVAGAAVSAGALGNEALVRRLDAVLTQELERVQLPYETANGWALLARAWHALGDTPRAIEYERRARAIADRHGFHELSLTITGEGSPDRDRPAPPKGEPVTGPVDRRTATVLKHLSHVALGPEWALDAPLATR